MTDAQKRYRSSPKGRAAQKRWLQTPEGRASRAAIMKRYCDSPKGRATRAEYAKKWNSENPGYSNEWARKNPESRKNIVLKHLYKITLDDWNLLFARQDGRCAVCSERKRLYVDHCHATGRVRGLLCRDCNLALGHLKDSPELLTYLLAYLQSR